jgi:uncharacterized protein (TIGR03437 family)
MSFRIVTFRSLVLCLLAGCFVCVSQVRQLAGSAVQAKAVAQTGCENFEIGPPMQVVPAGFKIEFLRDLNNDGWLDLGVVDTDAQLAIWYGETGGLSFRKTAPLMAAQSVTIDDFDGDGYQDLLTPQGLWRNGNERFFALTASAPEQSTTLATGDFNGDGKADLVTSEASGYDLRIRLSNGDGSFTALPPVRWSREIKSVAVADFNRDNKLDLFITGIPNFATTRPSEDFGFWVSVNFGDGRGGFTYAQRLSDNPPVDQVAVADFNNDGAADLIFHSRSDIGNTAIYINDGKGNFVDNRLILGTPGGSELGFMLGDFNGDQKPDILRSESRIGYGSSIFLNNYPNFAQKVYLPELSVAGDVNRDGRTDFISSLGIHLSRCTTAPQKRLAAASAASYSTVIAHGSIASIFGTNLAATTVVARTLPLPYELAGVGVLVQHNGVQQFARLLFVSPTQINFIVPGKTANLGAGANQVKVLHANNEVSFGDITLADTSPGLFAANGNGRDIAAALVLRVRGTSQTYENVARFDTALNRFVPVPIDVSRTDEEVYLVLYGTGLPPACLSNGQCFLNGMSLTAGGSALPLSYVGRQGSIAGLDQINALLPRSLANYGLLNVIFLNGNNAPSNTVQIQIR